MADRGKASPDRVTQQRLFAASAGHCQNPHCNASLFEENQGGTVHVAEMAHVFAAKDDGPRGRAELSPAERGAFENLIVLCSSCHTKIDKAEADYPPEMLLEWKSAHQTAIENLFGAVKFATRAEALSAIEPLMLENSSLFNSLNPSLPYGENPESELAEKWKAAMRTRILPNNRRILVLLDRNRDLMNEGERLTLEEFRQHVNDLTLRHFTEFASADQRRFPPAMKMMMKDE
jgi:hypothetical protein